MSGVGLDVQAQNAKSAARAAANLSATLKRLASGPAIKEGLALVGLEMMHAIQTTLSQPGTGRVYGTHQASAPGEPPAPDTGSYRASFSFDVMPVPGGTELVFGTPDRRAPWLEFGTRRMLPRPHFRPVVAQISTTLTGTVAETITRDLASFVLRLPKP